MKRNRRRPLFQLVWTAPVLLLLTAAHPVPEAHAPQAAIPGQASEQRPRLIGGLETLHEQLRYPQEARRMGVEGTVVLSFDVDEAGRVQDAVVVRGIGYGADAEALRVLRSARFHPGLQNGRPVRVACTLPFVFRLSD